MSTCKHSRLSSTNDSRVWRCEDCCAQLMQRTRGLFVTYEARQYPQDYCLFDFAAYGACILSPEHSGAHADANGYSFTGKR